jgi:hypothetical protein
MERVSYGLELDWWYPRIWNFENKLLMRPISLGIPFTRAVIKCIKISDSDSGGLG